MVHISPRDQKLSYMPATQPNNEVEFPTSSLHSQYAFKQIMWSASGPSFSVFLLEPNVVFYFARAMHIGLKVYTLFSLLLRYCS